MTEFDNVRNLAEYRTVGLPCGKLSFGGSVPSTYFRVDVRILGNGGGVHCTVLTQRAGTTL
jgi:hypothetical protein